MKVLFIGGSGNISSSVSQLSLEHNVDLYHLNRGNRPEIKGVKRIEADIHNHVQAKNVLQNHTWDVVVNWIAFTCC